MKAWQNSIQVWQKPKFITPEKNNEGFNFFRYGFLYTILLSYTCGTAQNLNLAYRKY